MMLKVARPANAFDKLIILATIIYYVLIDAVGIMVGAEGSRLGGAILIGQLAILIILYLLKTRGKVSIRLSLYHLYFVLFISYCFINCLWASYYNQALARTEQLAEIAILMIVVYTVFDNRENAVDELLTIIMIGGFLLVTLYIAYYGWAYIVFSLKNADRISSDLVNANTLGMSAAYSCVIFMHKAIQKKVRIWWVPFLALSGITLVVSQSRKAILILVLGIIGVFILNNHRDKNKLRAFGRILLSIGVIVAILILLERSGILTGISARLEGLINLIIGRGEIDKSSLQRKTLVSLGIELFRKQPIFGIGIDCARYFSPYGYNYHLHNNYLELLAGGGIIGIVVYYWIYLVLLIGMIKYRNFDDPEYNICVVLLLIRLIMDYGYFSYKEQGTYFFLLVIFIFYKKLRANTRESR